MPISGFIIPIVSMGDIEEDNHFVGGKQLTSGFNLNTS